MPGIVWMWLEMDGEGWKWPETAINVKYGCKWHEMAVNWWKWLETD